MTEGYTRSAEPLFRPLVSTLHSLRIASHDLEVVTDILRVFQGQDSKISKLVYEYVPRQGEGEDGSRHQKQALLEAIVSLPALTKLAVYQPSFLEGRFSVEKAKTVLECRKLQSLELRKGWRISSTNRFLISPINPNSLLYLVGIFGTSIEHLYVEYCDGVFGTVPPDIDGKPIITPRLHSFIFDSTDEVSHSYFDSLRPKSLTVHGALLQPHVDSIRHKILNRQAGDSVFANLQELHLDWGFWLGLITRKGLRRARRISSLIESACIVEGIYVTNGLHDLCECYPDIVKDADLHAYGREP